MMTLGMHRRPFEGRHLVLNVLEKMIQNVVLIDHFYFLKFLKNKKVKNFLSNNVAS